MLRTSREFAWPLSGRGAYTTLSDEDIEIGGLSDFHYCWHAVVGGTGEVVQVEGGAGVRGAAPAGLSRNELQMFHKKILSRILVCSSIFRNSRYQCSGSVLLLSATLNKWAREKKVSTFGTKFLTSRWKVERWGLVRKKWNGSEQTETRRQIVKGARANENPSSDWCIVIHRDCARRRKRGRKLNFLCYKHSYKL